MAWTCGLLVLAVAIAPELTDWLRARHLDTPLVLFATVHAGGFLYGQGVSSQAVKAFDAGVRDWGVSRRINYLLAAGPPIMALLFVIVYPSLALGLLTQLLALVIGYHWTDKRPSGLLSTLKAVYRQRSTSQSA